MEQDKKKRTSAAMNCFPTQKDPLPWNEAIDEDRIRVGVARSESPLEVLPITQVMYAHHLFQPFPVCGNRKRHSPVLLLWQKSAGGNDQDLICHRRLRDMYLGTTDHD